MGQNNKKYLDYAGLEKLVDMHAVVPHPQVEITAEGAYKIAFDEHGHITSKSPLTAADLGVDAALHFVGVSTTDPATGTITIASLDENHQAGFHPGDVCLYKRSGEDSYEEYIYTGTAWELLGDASSYALKDVKHTSADDYILINGTAKGSADHSQNSTIGHKKYTAAAAAIKAIGRDAGGHVVIGGEITVQSGGGSTHDHTTSTTIAKDTYVTEVSHTDTKLSVTPTTAKVLKTIPGAFGNLDTASIAGVSGSTTASKATAGTAKDVAKAGTATRYGTANVGTEITGLAKRAASATTVGNANIATDATTVGNADVGEAVVYGKANVGTAITVQDGKADVGTAVVYGKANVGTAVSVAKQATAQTKVGNADVGDEVTYGTADVGEAITFTVGTADVGTQVTGLAKRAASQTIVGNANVATAATAINNGNAMLADQATTVITSINGTPFEASVSGETLVLGAITPTSGSIWGCQQTAATPKNIYEAVSSNTKIYGVTADQVSVLPAKAATGSQTITPAVASTKTLTPAKAVSDSSTKIYGVSGSVDITPAVAAPNTQTLTPAVASGRTKSIAPAIAAPSTQTLTPAVAATATIYGAVASETEIYGVTADQVSIKPATEAPTDQTIIPAVANGTITPYTFSNVTVPVAASAITVATGSVSVGGAGSAVMTGLGTVEQLDVMTDATIAAGTTGDVTVVADVTRTKNAAKTFTGTTDEHTCPAHTHTLTTA